ncbi:histamine N-methyltransferase A-like isoform X1 [Lytechinus pictus]|uniref:histamine N-methyltransferase A-like isoform X1 n=1 Tax=Lytechinus pictus TaxID=7653 RepID=UPI0030BA1880
MVDPSTADRWFKAMEDIPSLPENHERYREIFLALSPTFFQKGFQFDAVTGYFDSGVMGRLIGPVGSAKNRVFNMLAVGLGEGKHEFHMLQKLSSYFDSIRVTAVDPNKGMLQTFCARLNDCDVTKSIACRPFEGTYSEFLESSLADYKFDFITTIHSLYYTGDTNCVVESMLSSLQPTGIVYAAVVHDKNDLGKLLNGKPWLTKRTAFSITTALEIKSIAERTGCNVDIHRVSLRYVCSSIFDEDSDYGNMILDFTSMTPYFRRVAPRDIVEDVLKFWRNNLTDENGVFTACGDDGLVVISRDSNQ